MDEQTIFSQALAIESAEERSKFLDSACGSDRELRARIERLLRLQEDAGSFLEKTPDELVALAETKADESESESADRWKESLEPSDDPNSLGRLGPYEIAELIGRGGMGVVLRAFDTKLKRTVAIKILAPEFTANPMAVRRFLREARSAAAVSHDHVVTIHAIDEETQPPRIVMECVDGQSLQQKIDNEGALDLKSILRIGMQTAAGLSAAHKQGLVHRDIKPSNILLENGIERVKLTDFGLARAVDDIGVTRTGQITGTPQYMSPEQAQGHRVDHRTDLFSLGCVLYAMCTGRAAFRADSAVAVMHRVVHDTPKPIREANEEIPEWLCEIVDKLLEKNPADRFASAREVEELLGQHLAHLQQPQSVSQPARLLAKTPARDVRQPPTGAGSFLSFWMTPQPEFAKRVGRPVMLFVGVWLYSLLAVMIGQAPEFVQALVLSTGFLGLSLLLVVLSVSAWLAARKKSEDGLADPTDRNGIAGGGTQQSTQRRATEILTLIGFLDLFLVPVFFLWIAPVLTASGSSAPLAGIACMVLSPAVGLMLLLLTLVGRRFHVAQRTLSRESGLFASLLVLLPVGPIHILALPVSIWVLRVFYRAEQTGDSSRSSILESSGQTVEPSVKSASNWPLVYMAAVGVLIVLAGSEIDSGLLSRAWLKLTDRGQITLNLENPETEVYWFDTSPDGPTRHRADAVLQLDAGGYQIEWKDQAGRTGRMPGMQVSPGTRISMSIPSEAASVEVRGPYVGAFPVLADEPPTREEITAEVSAKSRETPRPQIANPTAVTSAELLTSNQQWKDLLSKASSIPLNEWNTLAGDIKGPNVVAVRGEPLSLVLLNLDPFAEQKKNEHVFRDFWYLTESMPKPQELADAISVSQKEGYVSFLQPERMTNLTFEEADGTVEGSVGFSVPKLYSGRVEFMARRYDDHIWRIDEFRLPNYDITLRRNTQNLWQKVRTARNSGNRTEGSRSSP